MLLFITQRKDNDHYTPEFIAEKYDGLNPNQIIDMKGLMGMHLITSWRCWCRRKDSYQAIETI